MTTKRGMIGAIQDALLDELAPRLLALGFATRRREQSFERRAGPEGWFVHVGFVRHQTDVDATLDLAVRVRPVEDLLNAAGCGVPRGATFGAELGNIVDGRGRRWSLAARTDCGPAATAMVEELEKFGVRWFERYADLELVLSTLAAQDRISWLYSPIHLKRCLTIVALARYLGPPGRAAKHAEDCRAFLEGRKDAQVHEFNRCASLLIA